MTAAPSRVVAVTSGRTRLAATVLANRIVATLALTQATTGLTERAAPIPAIVETTPLTAIGDHHGSANAAGSARAASPTSATPTACDAGHGRMTMAAIASSSNATGTCRPCWLCTWT